MHVFTAKREFVGTIGYLINAFMMLTPRARALIPAAVDR